MGRRDAFARLRQRLLAVVLVAVVLATGAASAARIAPDRADDDDLIAAMLVWPGGAEICGDFPGAGDHVCPLCLVPAPPQTLPLAAPVQRLLGGQRPLLPPRFAARVRAPPSPPARAPPFPLRTA